MSPMRSTGAASQAAHSEENAPTHAAILARQLIRHLGVDGATRTCQENHWDGVLTEVMRLAHGEVAQR